MTYTGRDLLATRTEAPGTPVAATVSYSYRLDGELDTKTDERGNVWTSYEDDCCELHTASANPLDEGTITNKDPPRAGDAHRGGGERFAAGGLRRPRRRGHALGDDHPVRRPRPAGRPHRLAGPAGKRRPGGPADRRGPGERPHLDLGPRRRPDGRGRAGRGLRPALGRAEPRRRGRRVRQTVRQRRRGADAEPVRRRRPHGPHRATGVPTTAPSPSRPAPTTRWPPWPGTARWWRRPA